MDPSIVLDDHKIKDMPKFPVSQRNEFLTGEKLRMTGEKMSSLFYATS